MRRSPGCPARYREPVVLCYLEGLTAEAAAHRLRCPRGTVLSRLSRARERLRARLTRRGLAMPPALLASGTAAEMAKAIPAALLDGTVRASLEFAKRSATAIAPASPGAVALAQGVLHAMTIAKLKILGAAALACTLAVGGLPAVAMQFGGLGRPDKPAAPETDDRAAAVGRAVEKLQAELDESNRRNAELRKELQDIRAALEALRAAPRLAAGKAAIAEEVKAKSDATIKGMGGIGGGGMGFGGGGLGPDGRTFDGMGRVVGGGGPDQPRYSRIDHYIFATTPTGDKVQVADIVTGAASTFRLRASKEEPLEVTPIVGPGAVALVLKGPKITRIAAARDLVGPWITQDLREPVEGRASPIVGPGTVAYGLGRYVYAFSPGAGRWGVLELPEGIPARPIVGPGTVTVEWAGHIDTFNAKTGAWTDIDIKALLESADDKEKDSPEPKK